MNLPDLDFSRIRSAGPGGQREGFEQFTCQLAAQDLPAEGGTFHRLHGAGGDGGVECFWQLADGNEHGWQSKFWTDHADVDKSQLDSSVKTALNLHPRLTRYTIAIPTDPTGRTAGRGLSVHEKVYNSGGWLDGWKKMASDRGMSVEFIVEWKTNLLTRLESVDGSGVQRRYWFDADVLTEQWWHARLDEAVETARPRYVPELTIDVPAATSIAAMCTDPEWQTAVSEARNKLTEALTRVQGSLSDGLEADLASAYASGQLVSKATSEWRHAGAATARDHLTAEVERARAEVGEQEQKEKLAMTRAHGDSWDSESWRQFMREYQVSFPAEPVDSLRELLTALGEITALVSGPVGQLAGEQVALMTGAAGMGKTYVALDVAARRLEQRKPSVVVHGRWFTDGDPLVQLRDRLQLPPDLTGDEVLALLDQAGHVAGSPVLLVVDALNDTRPRSTWRDNLDRLCAAIRRHPHLRLLLTARTHYLGQVLPSELRPPRFNHSGFEGVEFEAISEYAAYYGLEPPTSPPIHGEFDNPLYLRLVCEALQRGERLSLDQAAIGLDELARLVLDNANDAVSDRLDASPQDKIVPRAMTALAAAIADRDEPWLTRADAREVITPIWSDASAEKSLLDALIAHGLLEEDVVPDDTAFGADIVTITFERLGHHLMISDAIAGATDVPALADQLRTGRLRALVGLDGTADRGLLEALSVVAAERFGVELTAFRGEVGDDDALLAAVIAGIGWRNDTTITDQTREVVTQALGSPDTFDDAMTMVFRLAARPDHPLNADFLHELLTSVGMPQRDSFLVPWLHQTHGRGGAVDRLIRWAREKPIDGVGPVTTQLWVTGLLWCTGTTDRRVRDTATLAAVRLLRRHPELTTVVLERFLTVDDDWIVERVCEVAYAALLANGATADWAAAAEAVWLATFSDQPPTSAAIRDAARSVLEATAERSALPATADPDRFRPPYTSDWPIDWPDESAITPYDINDYPKLVFSCTGDDFFTYQISWALRDRAGVDLEAAARRIVLDVIDLGYTPALHARFDRYVLGAYGAGRGKPAWIERLGKKYQWIALARLIGVVNDHVERDRSDWDSPTPDVPGPQSDRLRQLDPTVFEPPLAPQPTRAWVPAYDWSVVANAADPDWVADDSDLPEIAVDAAAADGRPHVVLTGSYEWADARQADESSRRIWCTVTSLLVSASDLTAVMAELDGKDLAGDDLLRTPMFNEGFVGEYPFGHHHGADWHVIDHERTQRLSAPTSPANCDLLGEYEYAPDELSKVSLDAPGREFFGPAPGALRWEGRSGWVDESGQVIAQARHVQGDRHNELLIDAAWLDQWLSDHDMALVWLELTGKDVYGGLRLSRSTPGRLMRTLARSSIANGSIGRAEPGYTRVPARTDADD